MAVLTVGIVLLSFLSVLLWWHVRVPSNLPQKIPKIPIYVSLLGLWSDMGQDEIYDRWLRQPLEKYGAVRFWFAGRWSLLVTKPEYLTDLFRNEDVYAKAGNQKKIPWSVMASLLGDNIISSHGDNWRLYTSVMKPGMTKRVFDTRPLVTKSRRLVDLLLQDQSRLGNSNGVLVNPFILRWAITVMGESFLDIDFQCLENAKNPMLDIQTTIKQSIFKPLYLNFPILDKYPILFASRKRAFILVKQFEDLLCNLIENRPRLRAGEKHNPDDDQLIHMLEQARKEGRMSEAQYRANLKITFIVAHENTQLLLTSMFYEIGKNKEVQAKLRTEILSTCITNPTATTVNSLPYLTSVIYELLRLYPPISQLTNRISTNSSLLANTLPIPASTYIGWNAYGVHTSVANWGSDAREFRPERWGKTVEEMQMRFRRETVRGTFIPFNAHTRKCLGQGFVLLQMKVVVFELLRRVKWKVEDGYKYSLNCQGAVYWLR